ncbi:MAG: hypothetical protein ABI594_09995 [Ginsengibacter sp.]
MSPDLLSGGWGEAMKKYLSIITIFWSLSLHAQHMQEGVKLVQYVFNEFASGEVKMKSGEISTQLLNYNILTNEMIFDNHGKYLAIASPENVDTVIINNRKFIPLNNKFYEVLVSSKMPLLLEFTASIKDPGTATGYGGTSNTTASTALQSLISTGGAYDLKLPDGYSVTSGYAYWIMKDRKLEKAGSVKQLIKIFPDKKEMINDFIKKSNTNFSKSDDVAALVKEIE